MAGGPRGSSRGKGWGQETRNDLAGDPNGTCPPSPAAKTGGGDPVKSPQPHLPPVACLAASLTACATTTPRHAGAAALAAVHSPGRSAHTRAGCPLGRLLPPGAAIAIDYVDFLRFGRHMYIASAEPITASM